MKNSHATAGPDAGRIGASAAQAERPPQDVDPHVGLITMPVRALVRRAPVTLPPTASIRAAAEVMRDQRVSSVLVVEDGHLFGIVTDRDLRNRAIAAGLDTQQQIVDIATLAPFTTDVRATAFDTLLLMARQNVHHVPVMDGQRVAGIVTATDLLEQQSTSAVHLAGEIYRQDSIEGLQLAAARIGQLQRRLALADATAYATGHVITAMTDAITTRLLQLAEKQLGRAPVDFAWVAAGSQARCEQTAKSDQDNCLILDDSYDEAQHGDYFTALAGFVCGGLDACGYVYCPGEMMAKTDTWRQPQHRWQQYFRTWVGQPEPRALMLTCVFFDMRTVYGRAQLLDDLRRDVLARTRGNGIFLAHMVNNALDHRPPLSLFGRIATASRGAQRGTIDLKHSGIVPIVDLARVYALASGDPSVNTQDRLEAATRSAEVSEQSARDLIDALEYLAVTRIRHQARQIETGQPPDNFLAPKELSNFQRTQLKDAFAVVQTLQSVLSQRYLAGRF
ncbi:MAG: putative nucleotidyltransferase substrate binding domain-containing protein [Gemmatimonadota bacterium]